MKYRVITEQDEDGVFVVECPAIPRCNSQRSTYDEALENIKDALHGYVESIEKHGERVPPPTMETITTECHRGGEQGARVF